MKTTTILCTLLLAGLGGIGYAQQPLTYKTATATQASPMPTDYEQVSGLYQRVAESSRLSSHEIGAITEALQRIEVRDSDNKEQLREVVRSFLGFAELREQYTIMQELLRLLRELGCEAPTSDCYTDYGISQVQYWCEAEETDSAKALLTTLLDRNAQNQDPRTKAILAHTRGMVVSNAGSALEAIQNFEDAAVLFEAIGDTEALAVARANIGAEYSSLQLYEKAKAYYNASLRDFERLALHYRTAFISANLSIAYMRLEQLDSAYYYALISRDLNILENNMLGAAKAYSSLGNITRRQGKHVLALAYADSSIALCRTLGMSFGIGLNWLNKSETYLKSGRYTDVFSALDSAGQYLPDPLPPAMALVHHFNAAEAYYQLGDYRNASRHYAQWAALKEDNDATERQALALSMDNSFAELRADRKITALNQQLRTSRLRNQLAWVSALLLLLAIVALLYWVSVRRRTHRLEVELAQRKLHEIELEMAARQKEAHFGNLKTRLTEHLSEAIAQELRESRYALPEAYRFVIDQLQKRIQVLNVHEEAKAIDYKLNPELEDFQQKLIRLYPDLSPNELKLCNLLKLNLSSRDIAKLIDRSEKTVNNLRSTIRRKMELDSDTNLTLHLMSLDPSEVS